MSGAAAVPPGASAPRRRAGLSYVDEDAVIADVRRLRSGGYVPTGSWSLAQTCFHLDRSVQSRMRPGPFPPNTPEQGARRPALQQILAEGALPGGLPAPDAMVPPPDCPDGAIDAFLATMERFKAFPGPIAPHRIFGQLGEADARRVNLIHCAHHLSYLVPTTQA